MPRARFAKAVSQSAEAPERASVREALSFDVEADGTSDHDSLKESRVASFHTALLLGATHLLIGITCILLYPQLASLASFSNPLIPLGLILALDGIAALALQWRNKLELAPHTVSRGMCIYLAGVGVLWTLFGLAVIMNLPVTGPVISASICAGIAMAALVAINSPPLAVVNAFVATGSAAFFSPSPVIPVGVTCLSFLLVAYSVATARTVICRGKAPSQPRCGGAQGADVRRRVREQRPGLVLGDQPRRDIVVCVAAASGRFQMRARGAARPPVHRFAFGRHRHRPVDRAAQDPRLPSVGTLPLLRRHRPGGERSGYPLDAFGKPGVRRSRPLPGLPRDRHRPYRAAADRAGDFGARTLGFADGPAEPGDDAPDSRGSASKRRPPAEGVQPVPDRPRPLQERQRHARPPGRRRASARGRGTAEVGDGRAWPGRPPRRRRVRGGASRHRRHRSPRIALAHSH